MAVWSGMLGYLELAGKKVLIWVAKYLPRDPISKGWQTAPCYPSAMIGVEATSATTSESRQAQRATRSFSGITNTRRSLMTAQCCGQDSRRILLVSSKRL